MILPFMNAAKSYKYFQKIVQALYMIGGLHLYDYMWPLQAVVQDGDSFDFIVIGAGTAGSVLATRLAQDNKTSVLLIEAGGNPPEESKVPGMLIFLEKTSYDWNEETETDFELLKCKKEHAEDTLVGKMLGGTSSSNHLMVSNGHPTDYDTWAQIANDDTWKYDNVRPYFVKATTLHDPSVLKSPTNKYYGTDGPIGITIDAHTNFNPVYLKAFQELGHKLVNDINPDSPTGVAKAMYNVADGVRQSTAYRYLSPNKDLPNLKVLKNTIAKKINFDENNNAVSVDIVTESEKTLTVNARKEIIVSGGAVKSPQLLMLSGIGPRKHLESKRIPVISDLPVGQNYQDQVATILIYNMTNLVNDKLRNPSEYPVSGSFLVYGNLDKNKQKPTMSFLQWVNKTPFLIQFCVVTYRLNFDICNAMFNENDNEMVWTLLTNLNPKSRGEILLRSVNYKDSPIVKPRYFSKEEDLENQLDYIEHFVKVSNTPSYKNAGAKLVNPKLLSCKKYDFGTRDYWRCYAKCMLNAKRNYCGTNAMGSVVDGKLRVKGVNRLRVCDASVIPVIPSSDIHLSVIMIAEKTADFIKEEYNVKPKTEDKEIGVNMGTKE